MMRNDQWLRLSNVLGVLALFATVGMYLALTDIYHGEADPRLEWNMVRVGITIIPIAQVVALVTLRRVRQGPT